MENEGKGGNGADPLISKLDMIIKLLEDVIEGQERVEDKLNEFELPYGDGFSEYDT